MKRFSGIYFLLVLLLTATVSWAETAQDRIPYRIISYQFNSDAPDAQFSSLTTAPLLITGASADILTDPTTSQRFTSTSALDPHAITDIFALSAEIAATPDLSVQGSLGFAKNRWDEATDPHYNSAWEANLGIIYKLLDNLSYEIHFGYMDTGDLFRDSDTYTGVESIIMINNKLTMSF